MRRNITLQKAHLCTDLQKMSIFATWPSWTRVIDKNQDALKRLDILKEEEYAFTQESDVTQEEKALKVYTNFKQKNWTLVK